MRSFDQRFEQTSNAVTTSWHAVTPNNISWDQGNHEKTGIPTNCEKLEREGAYCSRTFKQCKWNLKPRFMNELSKYNCQDDPPD